MALLGGIALPSATYASAFIVPSSTITVVKDGSFVVPITIDPAGESGYTVRFALDFPAESLEVTGFTFGSNWIAVSQTGYDLVDNTGGHLIKSAGFPGGFDSLQSFGIVSFRAKNAGLFAITVGTQSFILNAESKSTLVSRPQIQVSITDDAAPTAPTTSTPEAPATSLTPTSPKPTPKPVTPTTTTPEPLPDLPADRENLFDIGITPQVETSGAGLISKVAPGELLPIAVRLLNLGNAKRVDVLVTYVILNEGGSSIYEANDTVAVETTAHFVRTLQIPYDASPGRYVVQSSILYKDQESPATSVFPFTVERKFLGVFQGSFILYSGVTLLIALMACLLALLFVYRRRREMRVTRFEYPNVPYKKRVFFELVSDTIADMRQRAGDDALEIAKSIHGLVIDGKTGRVLKITRSPSKVIAELVTEYEKTLSKSVSFSLRKD